MMKHKHLFFVSLFSLMLISNQTKAFWPVFDMGEIVPSIKGVVDKYFEDKKGVHPERQEVHTLQGLY